MAGRLAFSARRSSPPRARMVAAIVAWAPMASIVTRAPCSASRSNRSGNSGDLVRLAAHRLRAEHQAWPGGPSGDQVQGLAALAARLGAAGGLAVDGDAIRRGPAQALDPSRTAALDQLRIENAEHRPQRVVAGRAVGIGKEAAQELEVLVAPELDLDQVIGTRQRRAEQEPQDLGQGAEHLGLPPRVLQRREPVGPRGAGGASMGISARKRPPQPEPRSCRNPQPNSPDRPAAARLMVGVGSKVADFGLR